MLKYVIPIAYVIINKGLLKHDEYGIYVNNKICEGFCLINMTIVLMLFMAIYVMKQKYSIISVFMYEILCIRLSYWMYITILIYSVKLYILTLLFNTIIIIKQYNKIKTQIKETKKKENHTLFVLITSVVIFMSGMVAILNCIFILYRSSLLYIQ